MPDETVSGSLRALADMLDGDDTFRCIDVQISRHLEDRTEWLEAVKTFGLGRVAPARTSEYEIAEVMVGGIRVRVQTLRPGVVDREADLCRREAAVRERERELGTHV